jgi:hypothetical protein
MNEAASIHARNLTRFARAVRPGLLARNKSRFRHFSAISESAADDWRIPFALSAKDSVRTDRSLRSKRSRVPLPAPRIRRFAPTFSANGFSRHQGAVPQENLNPHNPPLPSRERSTRAARRERGRRRRRLLRRRPLSAIHGLRSTWAPTRRHPLPNPSPIKGEGFESDSSA